MKYMRILFLPFFLCTLVLLLAFACRHEPDIADIPDLCFDRDILPIFQNNCALAGCHDGTGEEDLVLNSYASIMKEVEPGRPESSEVYQVLTKSGEDMMPPDQPLSVENRTKIRLWIEQGARNTSCDAIK